MLTLAVSLEDTSIQDFQKFGMVLPDWLPFQVAGDIEHRTLPRLGHTSAYFIGQDARVRQVFPMETYYRANWWSILGEIDRLQAE